MELADCKEVGRDSGFERRYLAIYVALGVVLVLVVVSTWGRWLRVASPIDTRMTGVNPNVAPWWELAVLPEIGETTARDIVAYREETRRNLPDGDPVFRSAADLDRVKGIGPKTVEKIAPFLRFETQANRDTK